VTRALVPARYDAALATSAAQAIGGAVLQHGAELEVRAELGSREGDVSTADAHVESTKSTSEAGPARLVQRSVGYFVAGVGQYEVCEFCGDV
jgi:hypothetical protein